MPRNILLGSSRRGPVAGLRRKPDTFKLPRSQITLTNPTPSSTPNPTPPTNHIPTPNPTPPTNHIPSTNPSPTPNPTLTSDSFSITNAIPVVFRHIKHLETCVNYILEQTLLPNEIIIIISEYIDNEDNKKIIDELDLKIGKNNIKSVIKTFTMVQYAGTNRAIAYELCNSNIIIYQDCDDFVHKQRNEILLNIHMKTKIPHILHGWTHDKGALIRKIDIENIELSDEINKICTANGPVFLNKSMIGKIDFPNDRTSQDLKLNQLLSKKHKSILLVCNDIYVYNVDLSSWG